MRSVAVAVQKFFSTFYVESPNRCLVADIALVFGRYDPSYISLVETLWQMKKVSKILISGGIGKDSGPLHELKIPEAHYIASCLLAKGVPASALIIEPNATNGAENSRMMLSILRHMRIKPHSGICVGHPTNLLRLWSTYQIIAQTEFPELIFPCQLLPTQWPVKIDDVVLIDECRRLRDWPAKEWSVSIEIPSSILASL
jgi:hypothetical protein